MKSHPLGRPPKTAKNVERWTGKIWIPDDGKPGLSFSGMGLKEKPYAWGPRGCGCPPLDSTCPIRLAVDRTIKRFGKANVRGMSPALTLPFLDWAFWCEGKTLPPPRNMAVAMALEYLDRRKMAYVVLVSRKGPVGLLKKTGSNGTFDLETL